MQQTELPKPNRIQWGKLLEAIAALLIIAVVFGYPAFSALLSPRPSRQDMRVASGLATDFNLIGAGGRNAPPVQIHFKVAGKHFSTTSSDLGFEHIRIGATNGSQITVGAMGGRIYEFVDDGKAILDFETAMDHYSDTARGGMLILAGGTCLLALLWIAQAVEAVRGIPEQPSEVEVAEQDAEVRQPEYLHCLACLCFISGAAIWFFYGTSSPGPWIFAAFAPLTIAASISNFLRDRRAAREQRSE